MNDFSECFSNLTKADFDALNLVEIFAGKETSPVFELARPLSVKANEFEATKQSGPARAARTLGVVCLFGFNPHSPEHIFSPRWQFDDQRSPSPEDLPDALLPILVEVASASSSAEFKARIGDVCCLRLPKRNYGLERDVAKAYLEAAEAHFENHHFDLGVLRVVRALDFAAKLRPANTQHAFAVALRAAFDNFLATLAPSPPLLEVAEMLELFRSRLSGGEDAARLANLTAQHVKTAEQFKQWPLMRRFLICQADWTQQAGRVADGEALFREAAETHWREAEECLQRPTPDKFAAANCLARAVAAHRKEHRKSARADELELREKELRREVVEGLRTQRSVPPQLAQAFQRLQEAKAELWQSAAIAAANAAQGLSIDEAIQLLILCHPPAHKSRFEKMAKEELETSVWKSMCPVTLLDEDGNPFVKAGSYLRENPKGQRKVVEQRMLQRFKEDHVRETVVIFEAVRRQLLLEHNILPDHLVHIIQHSVFIPPGREVFFAQGLLAGFAGDFIVATHLLAPQVENAFRFFLENNGVITTLVEREGTKKQADLNQLFRHKGSEIEAIFGEDETFELEALLVRRWGCNLRNDVSHGRLWPIQIMDAPARYLWWLTLRLCLFGPAPIPKPWSTLMAPETDAQSPAQDSVP